MFDAGVAHPVERHLAKVEVASSSLVARSRKNSDAFSIGVFSVIFALRRVLLLRSDIRLRRVILPAGSWEANIISLSAQAENITVPRAQYHSAIGGISLKNVQLAAGFRQNQTARSFFSYIRHAASSIASQ